MLNWNLNPESRPLFCALEQRLRNELATGVADVCSTFHHTVLCFCLKFCFRFVDLNEPYVQMNANNFNEGQVDYLACMGRPERYARSISDRRDNDVVQASSLGDSKFCFSCVVYETAVPAYLPMKPILGSHAFNTQDGESAVSNPSYCSCGDVGEAKL